MPDAGLLGSPQALATRYDVALLDLDGVVYVGASEVDGAAAALASARELGMRLAFVTNNAARPPSAVAAHLSELGVPAVPGEVITSAQAAAHYLAERLPAGSRVLVVGTTGLVEALSERGLVAVSGADDQPSAIVQGYSPDTNWRMLAEGAVAIRRGLPWVATNLDATVPSSRGPLPGNGSLVAALRHATGATPVSTGKPDPSMHRETVERSGARRPLVVGDRLDTDIEGANAVGCASMLVLTGVTSAADLLAAPERQRPSYIAQGLRGLLEGHPAPEAAEGTITCGAWSVAPGDELRLATLPGQTPRGPLDALRSLCVAAWRTGVTRCAADDEHAEAALTELGLRKSSAA
ncbi:MAG TPA: HAD-IIA family hydrolase [Jatrophihabitantaceae bacterium]|nr:HAD-IIA family hydrolase [Jatrophihabitantaceae bacterium]